MRLEVSGYGDPPLKARVEAELNKCTPGVLGVASAFVSVGGVLWLRDLLVRRRVAQVRMVAGLNHVITHPNALRLAREAGWAVRTANRKDGIFHPKLLVAARDWDVADAEAPGFAVVGSANLTSSALETNIEANVVGGDRRIVQSSLEGFNLIWEHSDDLTAESLTNYAALFAEESRRRAPSELRSLGIQDSGREANAAVDADFASLIWVGLESFTGEHTLQVEIPREPAAVLRRIVGGGDGTLPILCEADSVVRDMLLRFYEDNQMFRLNIPNDTPGVDWVRKERTGLLVLSRGPEGGVALRLRVVRPGSEADELQNRSSALGTWGHTRTRFFGWQ